MLQHQERNEANAESSPSVINTLICHRDINRAVVCLGSFFLACEGKIAFRFFSDGSVSDEGEAILRAEFPASSIVGREEMSKAVEPWLAGHPLCREMPLGSPLGLKLIEMPLFCRHQLKQERFVYIDTDIMFFQAMTNWRELWARNIFLCERDVVLSGRPSVILKQHPMIGHVNTGFISFDLRWHDIDFIEWFLGQDRLRRVHHFLSEQTCWALLGARAQNHGAKFWQIAPDELVSNHSFKKLKSRQFALHFIAGLKPRIEEFAPLALNRKNIETAVRRELGFCHAKRLTLARAFFISVLNRTGLRKLTKR